ncbi:MAG: TMEM165/GDT1 family protein [Proteobacteria bacterium]|nr:TMEM165/GDT1 family protein [Pseudomonadota bacterium]
MNPSLFLSTFSLIFLAELPDKTAFATLVMSTKGRASAVFTGVALAFLVQSAIAVAMGGVIGLLPARWVHLGTGILFIGFALHSFFFHNKEEKETEEQVRQNPGKGSFVKAASKAFLVIFIAEWGDLTQLATASIAAKYPGDPLTIFCSATLALWAVTAIAVILGHHLKRIIHVRHLELLSTLVFAGVGVYFILTWFGLLPGGATP